MPYDPQFYRSKNVYLPIELSKKAEEKAEKLYMNFSVYVRHLIVKDLN